jgi:hypothetical protein
VPGPNCPPLEGCIKNIRMDRTIEDETGRIQSRLKNMCLGPGFVERTKIGPSVRVSTGKSLRRPWHAQRTFKTLFGSTDLYNASVGRARATPRRHSKVRSTPPARGTAFFSFAALSSSSSSRALLRCPLSQKPRDFSGRYGGRSQTPPRVCVSLCECRCV